MSESQDYTYERNTEEREVQVRMTKRGWATDGSKILVGVRDEHYDFSF
jgi:hypothetical protein